MSGGDDEEEALAAKDATEQILIPAIRDMGDALEQVQNSVATGARRVASGLSEADQNAARTMEQDASGVGAAERTAGVGSRTAEPSPGTRAVPDGPPWPAGDDIAGSARGKSLNPVNKRHTLSGVRSGMIKEDNSVILPGNEQAVNDDIAQIAAGNAQWNPETQRYEINGRSYGVEPSGTVFPDGGDGIVKLNRVEYGALKEIAKAGGDPSQVNVFSRDPKYVNNPDAIAKAKSIYDGTYAP